MSVTQIYELIFNYFSLNFDLVKIRAMLIKTVTAQPFCFLNQLTQVGII